MIKFIKHTVFAFLLFTFSNCDPCLSSRSCADTFAFRIVNKVSKQDLVFGTAPIYSSDSVYLLTTLPGYAGSISVVDSANKRFASRLLIPTDTFYLKVSVTDLDTIIINYEFVKSKCCNYSARGYGQIRSMKFNEKTAAKEGETFIFEK
jgi:hypothetical protein